MYRPVKRLVDLLVAGMLLLVAAPLMLLVAIAVRIVIGKPVIFRQMRPGLHEHLFACLKFRTMTNERDSNGQLLAEEYRITPLGRFLRRTSLDELPQLWNVLRGQLSFIGPRPLLEEYLPFYTLVERRRHLVRPGLTGWAQIHGRNHVGFDDRLAMDVWYVEHIGFLVDLRILLATVSLVLTQRGVEPESRGSVVRLDAVRLPYKEN